MLVAPVDVSVRGIDVGLDVADVTEDETTKEVVTEEDKDSYEVLNSSLRELGSDDNEEVVKGVVVGIYGNTEDV